MIELIAEAANAERSQLVLFQGFALVAVGLGNHIGAPRICPTFQRPRTSCEAIPALNDPLAAGSFLKLVLIPPFVLTNSSLQRYVSV